MNLAVTQMDSMTQQNAALVEQAAAAAQSLKEQAMSLQRAAAAFQVGDAEASNAPFPATPASLKTTSPAAASSAR